jgi:hypothetical protein
VPDYFALLSMTTACISTAPYESLLTWLDLRSA